MFHYRFVTSLLCSRLRQSLPLSVTSLYYLFKVPLFRYLFFTSVLQPSTVPSSVCYASLFIHTISTSLYYLLKISIVLLSAFYVTALFQASTVSSSVCYITLLFLEGFNCFIICLLRHYALSSIFPLLYYLCITSLLCSRFRLLLLLFVTSLGYLFKVPLFHYLFVMSLLYSSLRVSLSLFVT